MKYFLAVSLACVAVVAHATSQPDTAPSLGSERLARHVEVESTQVNPDHTSTIIGVLTYDDGTSDRCTFVVEVKEETDSSRSYTPTSRHCTAVSLAKVATTAR